MTGDHPQFGNLFYLRNIVFYKISPYHIKLFPSFRIKNTIRRILYEAPWIVPPLALSCLVYYSMDNLHEKYQRKIPGQFDDEDNKNDENNKE
ncbi:unnamed protein product [Diabrotica balteata]|uniref:Cytochrome b-c1 complex subunit 8 n=1 Tax=Diabrotica balteata TaxID=107213 RepID=A0A9N9T6R0_DIABA|nr:unnamed protein product [Diabrotica balteata]